MSQQTPPNPVDSPRPGAAAPAPEATASGVAVIIPVFNRERALIDALESVAAQTAPPDRVVIIDDGSTDDTADRAEKWIADAAVPFECRLIRQPNAGVSAARNLGVEQAGPCRWLAFLDSDDIWPADFLHRMTASLDADPDAVAASTGRHVRDDRTGASEHIDFDAGRLKTADIFTGGPPGTSNTLIRRDAFLDVGGYETDQRCGEDYQLFLRLTLRGHWLTVPGEPVLYRRNAYHKSVPTRQLSAAYLDRRHRLARILDRFIDADGGHTHVPAPVWRRRLGGIWFSAGKQLLKLDRRAVAAECFERAARINPRHVRAAILRLWYSPPLAPLAHAGRRVWRNLALDNRPEPADIVARVDEALRLPPDDPAVLKDQPGGRVVLTGEGDARCIVKLYRVGVLKAALYRLVRRTRAWRECRGAARLAAADIRLARPVALVDRPGSGWSEALLVAHAPGIGLDHWLEQHAGSEDDRRAVLAAVGRQFGRITRRGLVNRDHKSANIMIDPDDPAAEPTVIDPAGIRLRTDARVRRMIGILRETVCRYDSVSDADFEHCMAAAREADPSLPGD